jgi:hypothetical protein
VPVVGDPGKGGAGGGGEEEGGGWVSLALSSRGDKHQMTEHQDDLLDREVNMFDIVLQSMSSAV